MASAPTVIVSRRVQPNRDREFRDWNKRLVSAAKRFPGYVFSEMQPPGEAHPDEWITVYRFERQRDLDRWLDSDERRSIMADGEVFIEGATREQRVALADAEASAVTAVMSKRVRPNAVGAYRDAHVEITRAMSGFAGFIRSQVSEPVPGIQDEHVTVFTFDSRSNLDAWLDSDERAEVLTMVEPLLEGEQTLNVVEGFGGWFSSTSNAPVRWKQAIAVLLALYPTTLMLGAVQRTVAPDVPWVPALFVSNVLGVAILTWLLMPFVTTRLRSWLDR